MFKFRLIRILFISFYLVGCAPMARPTIQDTEIIAAPFEKVWDALVSTLSEQFIPIKTIDKGSGLIVTEFVTFPRSQKPIDEIAVKPSGWLYIWTHIRYAFSIYVTKSGENTTRVKITSSVECYENNVAHGWVLCYSKGVLEKEIFDSIKAKIK